MASTWPKIITGNRYLLNVKVKIIEMASTWPIHVWRRHERLKRIEEEEGKKLYNNGNIYVYWYCKEMGEVCRIYRNMFCNTTIREKRHITVRENLMGLATPREVCDIRHKTMIEHGDVISRLYVHNWFHPKYVACDTSESDFVQNGVGTTWAVNLYGTFSVKSCIDEDIVIYDFKVVTLNTSFLIENRATLILTCNSTFSHNTLECRIKRCWTPLRIVRSRRLNQVRTDGLLRRPKWKRSRESGRSQWGAF